MVLLKKIFFNKQESFSVNLFFIFQISFLFFHLIFAGIYLGSLIFVQRQVKDKKFLDLIKKSKSFFNWMTVLLLVSGVGLFFSRFSQIIFSKQKIGPALHIIEFKLLLLLGIGAVSGIYSRKVKKGDLKYLGLFRWINVLLLCLGMLSGILLRYY